MYVVFLNQPGMCKASLGKIQPGVKKKIHRFDLPKKLKTKKYIIDWLKKKQKTENIWAGVL